MSTPSSYFSHPYDPPLSSTAVEILPWLDSLIEPPARSSVVLACGQLLEVGAILNVGKGIFRLSPLGYHLSHLPMDVRVAKILVNGCLLSCLDPSLKVAAILSATKCISTGHARGPGVSNTQQRAAEVYASVIDDGYGGRNTPHHARCDMAASIALYDHYKKREPSFRNDGR